MENLLIVGSGPAGLTAAIYAGRASLSPLVLTGSTLGGQLSLTTEIENFPGFPTPLPGMQLVELMREQAERFGARIRMEEAKTVHLRSHPFTVETDEGTYQAKAIIIATGASARMLGVPGEKEYLGRGVSTCATCDGYFFRGKAVAVVGGGDSALEEALFLSRFASDVYVIHRRDRLRASQILQSRARANRKIHFLWKKLVKGIAGEAGRGMVGVKLEDAETGQESALPVDGVFLAVGHVPNTALFEGQIELDEHGYIVTDRHQRTSVRGVFAAGDVQDHIFRQAVTGAGTGAIAAIEAEKFIAEVEDRAYPERA